MDHDGARLRCARIVMQVTRAHGGRGPADLMSNGLRTDTSSLGAMGTWLGVRGRRPSTSTSDTVGPGSPSIEIQPL